MNVDEVLVDSIPVRIRGAALHEAASQRGVAYNAIGWLTADVIVVEIEPAGAGHVAPGVRRHPGKQDREQADRADPSLSNESQR